jgi:hypothetical protein
MAFTLGSLSRILLVSIIRAADASREDTPAMMRALTISIALAIAPVAAVAAEDDYVTDGGHLMCTTLQSYRDAQEAVSKHDRQWLTSIKECTQSRPGLKAEMMQNGPLTAKVKVYDDSGKPTIFWTSPTTVKEVRR